MAAYTMTSKLPAERIYLDVDFSNIFNTGVTITSSTVTITYLSGTLDTNPSAMIIAGSTISGMIVSQYIIGGLSGAKYRVNFSATGSDSTVNQVQLILPVDANRVG